MQVRLRVRNGDEVREIEATADPTHSVGDLAAAIAKHLRVHPADLYRAGLAVDPGQAIGESGLRAGDELSFADTRPAEAPTAGGQPELVCVAGPANGTRALLVPGTMTVGRSRSAALTVDDPFLSREHFAITRSDGALRVADLDSVNGTRLDGALISAEPVELHPGAVLVAGSSMFLTRVAPHAPPPPATRAGTFPFNRPPRVTTPEPDDGIALPAPPEAPEKPRLPLAASLAPLVIGAGLAIVTDQPGMLAFAVFSPVMAVWSYLETRRQGTRSSRRAAAAFEREVAEGVAAAEDVLRRTRGRRHAASPGLTTLVDRARHLRAELWERRPGDNDHLLLRVGWGTVPSGVRVDLEPGGSEATRTATLSRFDHIRALDLAPLTIPLATVGSAGVVADDPELVDGLARWLLAQVAGLHSPRDVAVALFLPPDARATWNWVGWLPHVHAPALSAPAVATTRRDAEELLGQITALLEERLEAASSLGGSAAATQPAVVLAIHGNAPVDAATLDDVIARGPGAGIHVVWFGTDARAVPGGVGALVEVDERHGTVTLTDPGLGRTLLGDGVDAITAAQALELALALAPIRDVTARDVGGAIPRTAPLLDLLGLRAPEEEAIANRWRSSPAGLTVTLGATAAGPFTVDLREDGPHALVGGTTGAGKSELLQSLVASYAATYAPTRITFLLIDYKGGAAFKDCVALPHVVGSVTDLDGRLVHRALVSLNAELKHREHLLADHGAKDLFELERRGDGSAPPSLVMVIDEFATLAKELPAFVDGVVDVAQRGRSLGIHLVLATQRPAGAINDNIRANTNLRIALRMNDASDSEDVIGSPTAARLPRSVPGRGYARTGHGELTEFQSAYVGGAFDDDDDARDRIEIRDLELGQVVAKGRSTSVVVREHLELETDLERLVACCQRAATSAGIPPQRAPWLPPLPEVIRLDSLPAAQPDAVPIGVLDLPGEQLQTPWAFDLETDGHLLVYGASGAGKTTLLRTLVASAARDLAVADLHVYGLDLGTRGLASLEQLPHVGSIVPGDDLERVARLLTFLDDTIQERRRDIGAVGAATLAGYRETGASMPRLLVVIDGYAGFTSTFERIDHGDWLELVPRLVADGRSVGVHLVITAQRRADVPMQVSGLIGRRIVLSLADPDEYLVLGVDGHVVKGLQLAPGQGLLDGRAELRVATVGDGTAAGQNEAIVGLAAQRGDEDRTAPAVSLLPREVSAATLPPANTPLQPFVGIRERDGAPTAVDLEGDHLLVAGPPRSGKSTALGSIAVALAAATTPATLYLFAPRRSPIVDLDVWEQVGRGVDGCQDLAYGLEALVAERPANATPVVVFIDDAGELADGGAEMALEPLVRTGRDVQVSFVLGVETSAAHRAYGGMIAEVRRSRQGLLLSPEAEIDGDLLGIRFPRRSTVTFPPGRGYLVTAGTMELVQVSTIPSSSGRQSDGS